MALPGNRFLKRLRVKSRLPLPIALMVIAAGVVACLWWILAGTRAEVLEREALRLARAVAQQAQVAHESGSGDINEPHGQLQLQNADPPYAVRMVSAWNLSPRDGLSDEFETWAWAELRAQDPAAPAAAVQWRPAWRVEQEGRVKTLRYLQAVPASGEACIACHAQAESRQQVQAMREAMGQQVMPRRQVHQLLGAIEVAVPMDGIETPIGSAWRRLTGQVIALVLGGFIVLGAIVLLVLSAGSRERARLQYWTLHDRTTGLPNRGVFFHRLEALVERSREDKTEFALVAIDLDRFKDINESMGHGYGDRVLRKLAERITDTIEAGDQAFRLSGDQFAVVLREPGELRALQKRVQKLVAKITLPMRNGEQSHQLGASVGVSRYPHDAQTAEALMQATDQAMYGIKENGRNNVSFYQAQLDSQANLSLALRDGMREAIRKNQFELYYQPIVHVASRRVVSVEALLRWRHPVHGLVPPNLFLAVAEDIGLLRQVDDWVIRESLRQRARWTEAKLPPFKVGINLSPQRFQEPGLLSQIDKALAEHGVAPDMLALEVTEGALARNTERVAETLTRCHRRGVQIVLDDFGTGYSSMSLLKLFPIDVLKVDKSFVDGLPDDRSDCTLASAIVGLSHSLGIAVVAEGVETLAQFDHLINLGCENMQGFLIARPLPSSGLEALVRDELFNLPLRGVISDAAMAIAPIGGVGLADLGDTAALAAAEAAEPEPLSGLLPDPPLEAPAALAADVTGTEAGDGVGVGVGDAEPALALFDEAVDAGLATVILPDTQPLAVDAAADDPTDFIARALGSESRSRALSAADRGWPAQTEPPIEPLRVAPVLTDQVVQLTRRGAAAGRDADLTPVFADLVPADAPMTVIGEPAELLIEDAIELTVAQEGDAAQEAQAAQPRAEVVVKHQGGDAFADLRIEDVIDPEPGSR